jgi:circadian clock protein KaiC
MAEAQSAGGDILPTGVPNLDRVLGGGLLRRSIVVLIGSPGIGKTVLAQQMAFHTISRGEAALYLTGYSETTDKLISHSRDLTFFDPAQVGGRFRFGSLTDLVQQGADVTEDAVVATAREQRASLVVIDGFRSLRTVLGSDQTAAAFLYSLGAKLTLLGATTLVIIEGDPDNSANYPELTVCDVILALRRDRGSSRGRRLLEVVKSRGSLALEGVHPFTISRDGLYVSPRFEATVPQTDVNLSGERFSLGVPDLDALLNGGLSGGTSTLVVGSPGVGKTLLSLHFLHAALAAGEPCLYLGFMESAAQLREKGRTFGMDLTAAEADGRMRFLVLPPYDLEADAIAELLREDVERRGVRALVIDSAAELERGVRPAERVPDYLAALTDYLRGRRVTTYLTLDIATIVGPELAFGNTPLSLLAENLLLLRQVEYGNRLHRVFSVLKMRFSGFNQEIYEFTVADGQGIRLQGPAPLGEGLLTGVARLLGTLSEQRGDGADRAV